jgi:hypothetical protein
MKFSVKIDGVPAEDIEAKNACDAVDAARAAHEPPEEGGHFLIEVSCSESWKDSAGRDQPAGVVSAFGVRHEPAEHMREAVEAAERAAAEAKAKAEERAKLKAELLAEIAAEQVTQ